MEDSSMMSHQGMDGMPMDTFYTNHHHYGEDGGGSIGSRSNLSMTSGSKRSVDGKMMENFTASEAYIGESGDKGAPRVSIDKNDVDDVEDEMTKENEAAVTQERQMIYKDNTDRLQSILQNIKNSTKTVLHEMSVYLQEMEDVEKTYIRCRAKTQKESRRLEQVAPDVAGATQRYLTQASALLVGNGVAGGFDMAAMMGGVRGASAGTD